ncbi:MAG TPA: L-rhamnose mutarotase [Chryseolinea sp.]|nr:L-rhamnose mutarotase [Chryseolinea sp.]
MLLQQFGQALGGVRHAVSWLEEESWWEWHGGNVFGWTGGKSLPPLSACLNDTIPYLELLFKPNPMASDSQRLAFRMKLKPGKKEEYRKRHAEIWPELQQLLSDAGVHEYSIFLDENSNSLFAFQKLRSGGGSQALGENPIVQRWWKHMADIMDTNPDFSPISVALEEVFYMP